MSHSALHRAHIFDIWSAYSNYKSIFTTETSNIFTFSIISRPLVGYPSNTKAGNCANSMVQWSCYRLRRLNGLWEYPHASGYNIAQLRTIPKHLRLFDPYCPWVRIPTTYYISGSLNGQNANTIVYTFGQNIWYVNGLMKSYPLSAVLLIWMEYIDSTNLPHFPNRNLHWCLYATGEYCIPCSMSWFLLYIFAAVASPSNSHKNVPMNEF